MGGPRFEQTIMEYGYVLFRKLGRRNHKMQEGSAWKWKACGARNIQLADKVLRLYSLSCHWSHSPATCKMDETRTVSV